MRWAVFAGRVDEKLQKWPGSCLTGHLREPAHAQVVEDWGPSLVISESCALVYPWASLVASLVTGHVTTLYSYTAGPKRYVQLGHRGLRDSGLESK